MFPPVGHSQLLPRTETSTTNLQSASQSHDTLSLIIGTSKQLVTALEHTDWLDRVLIISALVFFGLVILFILKQRIVDRGLRIAFWWTRFIPIGGSRGRATGETLKEVVVDRDAGTSLTSIVATATTVSSTLASVLAATTAVPDHMPEDVSHIVESALPSSIVSESAVADDPRSTLISDPAHVEL